MLNCTTPFINKPTLTKELCRGEQALNASNSFMEFANMLMPTCPDPCINMLCTFGFPFISQNGNEEAGRVRLYLKSIVKYTEDFISYTFLRLRVYYLKYILTNEILQYDLRNWWIFRAFNWFFCYGFGFSNKIWLGSLSSSNY